jgi:hypothetical protein
MINCFVLLITKGARSRVLKTVPHPAVRRPNSAMQREPKEELTFGGAEALHTSLAPRRDDMPTKDR